MKILVAVDGSEQALDAIRHALNLHKAGLQASFVLANVQPPAYVIETVLTPSAGAFAKLGGIAGSRVLKSAETLFDAANVPFTREIVFGEPASSLVELAQRQGCESIIMGARGVGFLRSALMGSVSGAVLQSSGVPVTIVKHETTAHPDAQEP